MINVAAVASEFSSDKRLFIHFYQALNTSKVVKPGEHDSVGLSYYKLVARLLGAGRLPVRAE